MARKNGKSGKGGHAIAESVPMIGKYKAPFSYLMPAASAEDDELLNADLDVNGPYDKPLVSSEKEVLAGHRRLKRCPNASVIVIDTKGWTVAEKEAFVLKMNNLSRHMDA